MEPRTSIPAARLRAVKSLAEAGIPVGVMTAPIIPGLNDSEIPKLLEAAKDAGAQLANYLLLRLPLTVEPVFLEWLQRTQPLQADKVVHRIQETRGGKLSSSVFRERMRGTGEIADQIRSLFQIFRKKFQLEGPLPAYNCGAFRPPRDRHGQGWLF
jgi:DNA repair photolyase